MRRDRENMEKREYIDDKKDLKETAKEWKMALEKELKDLPSNLRKDLRELEQSVQNQKKAEQLFQKQELRKLNETQASTGEEKLFN